MTSPDIMSMYIRTVLTRNDRLSLTGVLYEPKGVTQRRCQVVRNLSPLSAYYSLCGKVSITHTNLLSALSADFPHSYGGSHPVPR